MGTAHPRCAVVGAANIDIGGFPAGMAVMRDSNPGRIRLSAGGVGRNIACNLARLGTTTHLVAALGTDAFARIIREDCAAAGALCDLAFEFSDEASSSYLFIADAGGDMQLAVNDMRICRRLTPEALARRIDALNGMDAVVIDANLPEATIAYLAENLRAPLLADAVSAAKARRLIPALPRLAVIKPNALEAEALTGLPVHDRPTAERAARRLVEMGVGQAYITLGERGVCCADAEGTVFIPGAPVQMVNATGAGDAFTAALAWALVNGLDRPVERAAAGLAAAALAVESKDTVNPQMSEAALLGRMGSLGAPPPGIEGAPPIQSHSGGRTDEQIP